MNERVLCAMVEVGGSGSDFAGALVLSVVGISVVFATLVVLALVIGQIVRLFSGRDDGKPAVLSAVDDVDNDASIDPRHRVVIAAAVAAALGQRSRVHRVVMLGNRSGRQWVTEGRVVVMGSHRPHR